MKFTLKEKEIIQKLSKHFNLEICEIQTISKNNEISILLFYPHFWWFRKRFRITLQEYYKITDTTPPKMAEDYLNDYYEMFYQNDEWDDLQLYALRIKKMYLMEIEHRRKYTFNNNEKELAESSIENVNKVYNNIINQILPKDKY